MEKLLVVAGCGQLLLILWGTDHVPTQSALGLGVALFAALVWAVRDALND